MSEEQLKILEQELKELLEGFKNSDSPDNQYFYHHEMEKIKIKIAEEKLK